MDFNDPEDRHFILVQHMEHTLRAWIGNMLRDWDAQGIPVDVAVVRDALDALTNTLSYAAEKEVDQLLEDIFQEPEDED